LFSLFPTGSGSLGEITSHIPFVLSEWCFSARTMNDQQGNTEMSSFVHKSTGSAAIPVLSDSTTVAAPIYGSFRSFLHKQNISISVLGYTAVFFCCMVGMEIVLEALLHQFPNLDFMATSVTLFQLGCCVLFPLVLSHGTALQRFPRRTNDFLPYVVLSILVFGSTGLATQSVKYVSYPTKVVFKSSKLIPTMLVASFMQRKIYSVTEYVAALLLCLGAAGYAYGGASSSAAGHDSFYGILLLIVSVFCDAIVPNVQKLSKANSNNIIQELPMDSDRKFNAMATNQGGGISADELMVNTNTVGFGILSSYMIFTGDMQEFLNTCTIQPTLLLFLMTVGTCLSVAVYAYTRLIQESGSVFAVSVATLRKVATVVLSFVLFPKPLKFIHIGSGFLVLGGILLSSSAPKNRTG
jgi:solute carrier family 35 (adenosine 3'-phospho 5'-phosphosulfate transporter), member B3